jgi:hypothetical protein
MTSSGMAANNWVLPAASAGRTAPAVTSDLQTGDQIGTAVGPAGGTSRPTAKPILLVLLPG